MRSKAKKSSRSSLIFRSEASYSLTAKESRREHSKSGKDLEKESFRGEKEMKTYPSALISVEGARFFLFL